MFSSRGEIYLFLDVYNYFKEKRKKLIFEQNNATALPIFNMFITITEIQFGISWFLASFDVVCDAFAISDVRPNLNIIILFLLYKIGVNTC